MGSLIRATNLAGFAELVRELDGDPVALLERFGLPRETGRDPEAFVSFRSAAHLVETTAEELACPDFALRLSRWQGLDALGPIAVIVRNEQTVLDALASVARFLHVHSPALSLQMHPSAPGQDVVFTYEINEPGLSLLRQCYELSMANFARVVSLLAGEDAHPGLVLFAHEQVGPDDAYAAALGCPVAFGQPGYGFRVPGDLVRRPVDRADAETRRIATRYLESEVLPHDAGIATQVAALSRRLLPVGQCTTEAIAAELSMHPRTLQRRLAEDGVRCQDVIDDVRRRQAVRYLGEPRLYLGQISRMLGFAEQSSLNRACRRWFGETPGQYRARLASPPVSHQDKNVSAEAKT